MAQLMMVAGVHQTERLSGYCYMNPLGTLYRALLMAAHRPDKTPPAES
ncbi:MAG: hypothetical protein JO071_14810 [Deltaproteobacteria bacterium]|nr:hypothetical protein [Deltaproteobacteria bacterium]